MTITFTKTGKKQNWVKAMSDESKELASFPWPDHPGLPHDLVHVVVESTLQLENGFWGLIAKGANITDVNNALEKAKLGEKVKELAGCDLKELYLAESLVAAFQSTWISSIDFKTHQEILQQGCEKYQIPFPEDFDEDIFIEVIEELKILLESWNQLEPENSLVIDFEE